MVATRSATKQTHQEGFASTNAAKERKPTRRKSTQNPSATKTTAKRKATSKTEETASKKTKVRASTQIKINRAPVLKLWSACVTQFLHQSLPWSTCLSAGAAISAICAVAKGRSIGKISEPGDESEKKSKKEKEGDGFETLEVMHFKLRLKVNDGLVYFGGKAQAAGEEVLKKKFGDEYDGVKDVFVHGLGRWKGIEGELGEQAFGMYEEFRPTVPKGEKGWGRKGVLDLDAVKKAIEDRE
jgi:hypothetical protein